MTVDELLKSMGGAFPAFDAGALKSWAPVFRTRMTRFEGDKLQQAYVDTLGTFVSGKGKAFPLPKDFEPHLPSSHPQLESAGPKLDFAGHAERRAALLAAWRSQQGHGIVTKRGPIVGAACEWEVSRLAQLRAWKEPCEPIVLKAEQIQLCEDRVVSGERNLTFGPINPATWAEQMDFCRKLVREGRSPSKEKQGKPDDDHLPLEQQIARILARPPTPDQRRQEDIRRRMAVRRNATDIDPETGEVL